jgi:hypothetical protein
MRIYDYDHLGAEVPSPFRVVLPDVAPIKKPFA